LSLFNLPRTGFWEISELLTVPRFLIWNIQLSPDLRSMSAVEFSPQSAGVTNVEQSEAARAKDTDIGATTISAKAAAVDDRIVDFLVFIQNLRRPRFPRGAYKFKRSNPAQKLRAGRASESTRIALPLQPRLPLPKNSFGRIHAGAKTNPTIGIDTTPINSPTIAKTQTESLQTSCATTWSSWLRSANSAKQTGHVLLNPGFAELMAAQDRFVKQTNEVSKFLDTIEQAKSAPKPTSATSLDQADGEKPTCHWRIP
jgi:hypothetical protein